ncbi:hypothetical protein M406DRAFT_86394 [Cryphonectria parasitica EP155]|uniref:Potassium transport protein n=1 Tax=Cryphonectria parasitica (strain ATCC 38755 / EP155) TaxID=660469 RepID=A0A9P5CSR2_CRYP1|nr:uncharacterized protein M406DRAFT_86394 [Cryphonectria parasitica EP155]KAF3769548.1 hypothetical protein M406DRAFT_86394 [Cryphonectria parasitica EP155]
MDSLFLVESAFTGSGLNTVNLSQLTSGQQAILAIMMILGSPVLISLFTIWFRAHIFEQRFEDIVEAERNRRPETTGTIVGMTGVMFGAPVMSTFRRAKGHSNNNSRGPPRANTIMHTQRAEEDALQLGTSREKLPTPPVPEGGPSPLNPIREGESLTVEEPHASGRPVSAYSHASNNTTTRRRPRTRSDARPTSSDGFDFRTFIRTNKKSIGRNGQFFDLTDEEREYLGGVEYRALRILFVIVAVYFVLFQLFGAIALGAWMASREPKLATANAQSPWWTGVFLCISSFNNAGMTLLDDGIAAYENDAFVLTIVTILALAGNYAFPAFIRATVFFCSCMLRLATEADEHATWKEAFDFILKYPRRLFMLMFPAKANWTFVAICTSLGVVNWVSILILSIGNSVLEVYPVGRRIGLALFQSLTLPSGGFTVISASSLYFDVLVLWVILMYVSAYPEIIVMRNSNVYEERSLGIYVSKSDEESDKSETSSLDQLLSPHDQLLPIPLSGVASTSAVSQATTQISTRSIKKLAAVGRRGTAFVGKQIQRRMNNFQGVGVAATTPRPPHLRRAPVISFDNDKQGGPPGVAATAAEEGQVSLVTQHLRSQLSHDIWCIALALFLIIIIETRHTLLDPQTYSVFNFMFEIVSGYTNIGLSLGVPNESYSFSGGWYTGSKFIMVVMMIRGRHRGLPVALDHAVKLPGWDNAKRQQEDAEIRQSLSRNRASCDDLEDP